MECYDVLFNQQVAGMVRMEKEGLYYRICCECRLPKPGLYRLTAICQDEKIPLGILIPGMNGFTICTKIATKKFASPSLQFHIVSDREMLKTKFIPLRAGMSFACISDLPNAKLSIKENQVGITISVD